MFGRLAGRLVTGPVAFLVAGLIDVALILVAVVRHRVAVRAGRATALWVGVLAFAVVSGLGAIAGGPHGVPVARADTSEPSILMDDYAFIYSSRAQVEQNLRQVAALGVNVVKVSVVWSLVAPDANSSQKPDFDATDPSAYPAGAWARYDTLVEDATALGLKVYFQLTAPAPVWATTPGATGKEHPFSHGLNPTEFGQFAEAVGKRYSGGWPAPATAMSSGGLGAGVLGGLPGTGASASDSTIPAVQIWGIWNEPNIIGWMSPQNQRTRHGLIRRAAITERRMIDGAYRALLATGHAQDVILIGETASGGETEPLDFIDELYCVNRAYEPLSGHAAYLDGCPQSGDPSTFVAHNPGLFGATGWAHHPYSFNHTPATPLKGLPYVITLANLKALGHTLDAIDDTYGEPGGLPIYITEWGYKTDPPNPFVHTSLAQQALWIDEGYYLTYAMPRVKAIAQEELYDQPPIAGKKPGTAAYWANFDSGLEFENGDPKPAYDAFRLPIWLPRPQAGPRVPVWAQIRPGSTAQNMTATLQYQAAGASDWSNLGDVTGSGLEGYVNTTVAIPGAGAVRLAWTDPSSGETYHSRSAPVS